MFARRHIQAESLAVMDHDPISSDIDPSLFAISGDRNVPRADISASVPNVVARYWKTQYVDVFLLPHILQQRPCFDLLRWDWLEFFDPLTPEANKLHGGKIDRHTGSKSQSLDRIEKTQSQAVSFGVSLDGIEEDTGRCFRFLAGHVCNGPDLQVPIGPFNAPELAQIFYLFKPLPEIPVTHERLLLKDISAESL